MTLNTARWIFVIIALIAAFVYALAMRASVVILAFSIAMILPGAGLFCALSCSDESSDMNYPGIEWDFKNNKWIV